MLPGLADLYTNMESKFHPLTLAKSICEAVAVVKATPQLAVYAVPLQRVAVLRVVLQLSRVYSAVKVRRGASSHCSSIHTLVVVEFALSRLR